MMKELRKKLSPMEKELLYYTFSGNNDMLPISSIISEYLNSDDYINQLTFRNYRYSKFSFPILSHELMVDIREKVNPKSVVDLACGPGWMSFWLSKYGVNVKDSVDMLDTGFKMKFSKSKIDITRMDVIDYLAKYNDKDDLLILSWPPYERPLARMVFEKMYKGQLLLYIGEGMGGCTADDEFHDLIEDKVLETDIHLDSFFSLHDNCFLIQK